MENCVLILDNIRSVENVGSIFRTADGLGVEKIFLIGTTPTPLDRFGRKRKDLAKVSLGAEDSVKWEYTKNIGNVIQKLKKEKYQIIALEQSKSSKNLRNFKTPKKFALIVGNEVEGVSKNILNQADSIVEIPMRGKKESFNVAVATGIALYTLLTSQ